jgi:hypothetical protein
VKASTSDKNTIHSKYDTPIILVNDDSSPASTSPSVSDSFHTHNPEVPKHPEKADTDPANGEPQTYFALDETDLRLSGVGVFSPAASRSPSPMPSRRNLLEVESDRTDRLST